MKIGIFTFHCAHNFGAVLQTFALQTYLQRIGHEVCIVDYRPYFLVKDYKKFSLRNWWAWNPKIAFKKFLTEPFLAKYRVVKWNRFNKFITNKLNLYPYPLQNSGDGFDLFLFGSDQIWNSQITGGQWDSVYFGKDLHSKCCSYAASMGWDKVDPTRRQQFLNLISKFYSISVREEVLYNELKNLIKSPVNLVCDPVLLLNADDWNQLVHPVKENRPYVLCFNLLRSNDCKRQAEIICQETGYNLIEITGSVYHVIGSHKVLQDIGPEDFISYIANAMFVITSSFHGTALSVIFRKSFYSVGLGNKAERVSSLLSIIGLENRLLYKTTYRISNLSYSKDNIDKLNKYILASKHYLENKCLK